MEITRRGLFSGLLFQSRTKIRVTDIAGVTSSSGRMLMCDTAGIPYWGEAGNLLRINPSTGKLEATIEYNVEVIDVFALTTTVGALALTKAADPSTIMVFKNGALLLLTTDYTLPNPNVVALVSNGVNGDKYQVRYVSYQTS